MSPYIYSLYFLLLPDFLTSFLHHCTQERPFACARIVSMQVVKLPSHGLKKLAIGAKVLMPVPVLVPTH